MVWSWWNFRNSIMSDISQIAQGFFNNAFKLNDNLYSKRIKICRECPLLKIDSLFGEVCNSALYINSNNETSKSPKVGFVKGCGCVMSSKARVDEAHCVINKW